MKRLSILVMSLMLMSFCIVPISAQLNEDVIVIPGEAIESPLTYEDIQPHETIGGIISEIGSTWRRFVSFLGIDLYKEEVLEEVLVYELVAFPADSVIDFNTLIYGDEFAVYEEVIIDGVNGTWTTYDVTAIVDGRDVQTPVAVGGTIHFDAGDLIIISHELNGEVVELGTSEGTFPLELCSENPGVCPVVDAQLIADLGL